MALAEAGLFLGDSQTETEIMQELNLNWSNANDKHLAKRTVESWFMDAGSSSLKFARRQFCSCSHCWTTAGVELGKKWTKHAAACWFLSLLELFAPFDKQWIRTQNNVWSGHAVSTGGYSSLIAWLFGWGALRTWVQGWEPNDVFTEVQIRLIDILQFYKPMPMYIVRTVCLLILFMFYGQFMYLFICFKF